MTKPGSKQGILFQDNHEPEAFRALIEPSVGGYVIAANNSNGLADFYWQDVQHNARQWERKQLGEALSDLDAVEEQLGRYLHTCDELTLVVEGIGLPTPEGVQLYELTLDKRFYRPSFHMPSHRSKPQSGLSARYEAWKCGLRAAGVSVVETNSLEMTARAVASAFSYSMVEEHTTLKRYVIPHIQPFDPDIHVENLARLKNCNIGVERAKKAVSYFGSFWATVSAPSDELRDVMGKAVAAQLLQTIGRREE